MLKNFLVLATIIYVSQCAIISGHKNVLNDDNFLNGKVDVHENKGIVDGGIHSISDVKTTTGDEKESHNNKNAQLDELLRHIYDKFVNKADDGDSHRAAVAVSASAQHKVKLGGNGKAYKVNNRVPEKKDAAVSNQHKAESTLNSLNDDDKENRDTSMNDVLNSVKSLIEKLSKKEKEDEEVKKHVDEEKKEYQEKKKEFAFETVENENARRRMDSLSNDDMFKEFKKKFLDMFLKKRENTEVKSSKDNEQKEEIAKRQILIGSGKDHHLKAPTVASDPSPGLIGSGKDSSHKQNPENDADRWQKDEIQTRFNKMYDELRKETADRVDSERNRHEWLELVKQDLVGLLNRLQTGDDTFSYHDGRFDKVAAVEEGKGKEIVTTDDDKDKKKESKLSVVESLVTELRELEANKKREQLKQVEEEKANESVKRVENIFMKAFREELVKRKRTEEELQRKKTEEEAEKLEKEEEALKKRKDRESSTTSTSKDNGRQMLLQLMGELDKRILDEKSKVEADKKRATVTEETRDVKDASGKRSSVEKELDSILSELSNEVTSSSTTKKDVAVAVKSKRDASENAIDKAFEGFNIQDDSSLKQKVRP